MMIKCIKAIAFRRPIGLFTDTTTVNKYGEITGSRTICFTQNKCQTSYCHKKNDQFTCFTSEGEVIFKEYRPYMHTNRPIPWEEIFEDWEKKPRSTLFKIF